MNTRFSYSQAIVWQIKFIIQTYLTKKTAQSASAELSQVSPHIYTSTLLLSMCIIFKKWSTLTSFILINDLDYGYRENQRELLLIMNVRLYLVV